MSTEPTKSAAKKAKAEAEKSAKKKPDESGRKAIHDADQKLANKDFAAAILLYQQAKDLCDNSDAKAVKPQKPKPAKPAADAPAAAADDDGDDEPRKKLVLELPANNLQSKPLRAGVDSAHNYAVQSKATLSAHLAETKGVYRTRFPPEPNGYLHIGHAKAMNFNFGQAAAARELGHGGETVLRFDDTNPEAEKQEYIDSILNNVAWLGHTPAKVTYSSDYFPKLYELALQLIRSGHGYVCHQTKEEMKRSRDLLRSYHQGRKAATVPPPPLPEGAASPYRERSVEENLRHFQRMRDGRYDEGEAFLRMKIDLHSENSSMWDPAAYRVLFAEHPRTGSEWCIYPTYDYTHCIVDSLENITHSLCTLEFEMRQAVDGPYYWLLHVLNLYKPVTWEYSRLNLTHALMSKRKLKKLVVDGHVDGWDDPRLMTLDGMRRRGFSPATINLFCQEVGVARRAMTAKLAKLEHIARQEMDASSPRRFAVLEPLLVRLSGLPPGGLTAELANLPRDPSKGTRQMAIISDVYIERSDFREVDDPKFYGLAPDKEVGLLSTGCTMRCTSVERDALTGAVSSVTCVVSPASDRPKPKGSLHWLSVESAVPAVVRVYDVLFEAENPEEAAAQLTGEAADAEDGPDDSAAAAAADDEPAWLKLLNPNSLKVHSALIEPTLRDEAGPPVGNAVPTFQFQRVGFFSVDKSSTTAKPVLNRVVALKEDKERSLTR